MENGWNSQIPGKGRHVSSCHIEFERLESINGPPRHRPQTREAQ
jgi:hypothetical protein